MELKEENVYTWPNPHFPFKCLLNHEKCRIFILENIPHNYVWLEKYKNNIRETDFFFVTLGWFLSEHLANQSRTILDQFKLNIDNFYILYNSPEEESNGLKFGLRGSVVNHNAWIDESVFQPLSLRKKYRALYIARPTDFKRHYLAEKVEKLALAAGGFNHRNPEVDLPPADNDTRERLSKKEICQIINESQCGLCLSREEGACYSSSEYLLCGVPVVSTYSRGGRDVWYTEYNSILCEDTDEAVKEAVQEACVRKWDGNLIRKNHQTLARLYRNKFLVALQEVLIQFTSPTLDAEEIFSNSFTWYCNENSAATPHVSELEKYFK
tara:strand:+ start:1123 stop:2097 length:975 start_codon:yes stop_codon:yes gene_type:complete